MMGSVVWMLQLIEVDAKIWQTFCEHFGNNLGIRQNCSISFRYMGKTFQFNICVCFFFSQDFMDILHREDLKKDLIISVSEHMNEIPYVQDFEEGAHNYSGTKFQ